MDNYFFYKGHNSLEYGVTISGSGTYKKPERVVERFKIPGRNGELTVSDGSYENVTLTYPCFIFGNFPARMDWLSAWLLSGSGYHRLEDTYHPEHFRLAEFAGPIEPDPATLNRHGRFELSFNCKPQKFLKSGEQWYEVADNRYINPTGFVAKPLLRFGEDDSAGTLTITVNGVEMLIGLHTGDSIAPVNYGKLYLDCDTWEAYNKTGKMNHIVKLTHNRYPELLPGENSISVKNASGRDETFALRVMPRWWMV